MQSTFLIIQAVIVAQSIGHASVYGTQASFYPELFGTRVRYSGSSLGYHQIAGILGGALAPIVATSLRGDGREPGLIGVYVAVLCLLGIVCVYLAAETFRRDIYEDEPQECQLIAEPG
jgi:MHS family shikimate/dehydroshikimate transporter-like MFS transporter